MIKVTLNVYIVRNHHCMEKTTQNTEARSKLEKTPIDSRSVKEQERLDLPAPEDVTIVSQVNDAVAADLQARAAVSSPVPKAPLPAGFPPDANHIDLSGCTNVSLASASLGRHRRNLSSLSIRSPMSVLGTSRHFDILSEDMPQPTLEAERGELAHQVVETLRTDEEPILTGVNLRDVASTSPETIRAGLVLRSSQVFSPDELKSRAVISAVDLRAEPRACKKARRRSLPTGIAVIPSKVLPDRLRLHAHRALPLSCKLCSAKNGAEKCLYKTRLAVFHIDMLPPRIKIQIFRDMPWSIRLQTIFAPLHGKSPQEVMTPAVADPSVLGYLKLYIMMLDMSMSSIAKALRVFSSEDNLPCVVHCIHGKDRTGLIIALLLLTLGVPEEVVVLDYAKSEVELKTRREGGALEGALDDYLIRDDIIASSAQTMEDTLRYLDTRYSGIRHYLRIIGITRREVHDIRRTLLNQEGLCHEEDVLSRFSMAESV